MTRSKGAWVWQNITSKKDERGFIIVHQVSRHASQGAHMPDTMSPTIRKINRSIPKEAISPNSDNIHCGMKR